MKLNKTEKAKYKKLLSLSKKGGDDAFADLVDFEEAMDDKYGYDWHLTRVGKAKGMMKKKGYAKGGMKKKGYAKGGFPDLTGDGKVTKKDILKGRGVKVNKGGMMKKKGYAKGGAMKKKAYAKGGKVAMYNVGGMVKSSGALNTGIKKAPNTYK